MMLLNGLQRRSMLGAVAGLVVCALAWSAMGQGLPAEARRLVAADASQGDRFGTVVALSGNVAIIGANQDAHAGERSGSAYLFDVRTGEQLWKLTASDAAALDSFGSRVAIEGNIALVGAGGNDDLGDASGAAYVFDVTTGAELAKILPSDGVAGDVFGTVTISGTLAFIGANNRDEGGIMNSGAVYVFDLTDPANPVEITKFAASNPSVWAQFGNAISIDGDRALIGAPRALNGAGVTDIGAAYVFDISDPAHPVELTILTAADGEQFDVFGADVNLSGGVAIVSSHLDDDAGTTSGSAYLFDAASGKQLAKLTAPDAARLDTFGIPVVIEGTNAYVGASFDNTFAPDAGSVYVFDIGKPGAPVSLGEFAGSDTSTSDSFGIGMAVDGNYLVAGASGEDSGARARRTTATPARRTCS
jgi:hypothetical protein